jgi:O-antigen/teichoic acid export membrane protein
MRLGKTTLSHFISQVVVSGAGFIATFAIARVLGAEGVGVYALGVALLTWLNIPTAGISKGITKRISESEDANAYVSTGALLMGGFGIITAAAILVFEQQVNQYVGTSIAGLLVFLLVSDILFSFVGSVLQGEKKVARHGWLKAFERLARTIIQIVFLLIGYEIAGLFFGHAIALAVTALIGLVFIGLRPSLPSIRHIRSLSKFAQYSWLGAVKGRTFGWMDTIVLGIFVSSALIGVYEVAWNLASFFVLVSNSIQRTLFPEISELSSMDNHDRIHHYLNEGLMFTGVFLIPGLFGAVAIGEDVLRIYSPEFTQGVFVLLLLIGARTFDAFGAQLLSAIDALNRPDIAFRVNLVFVVSNLTLNVGLIYSLGWYGAAIATLISGALTLILSYSAVSSLIGAPEIPYLEIGKQTVAGSVMFVCVIGIEQFLPQSHYITVLIVNLGVGIYLGVLVAISSRIRKKATGLTKSLLMDSQDIS